MLFLDFICYHGNHSVESALTKIIKITKLCNFFFLFVLVHSFFSIIIVDMLAQICKSNLQQDQMFYDVTLTSQSVNFAKFWGSDLIICIKKL